MLKALKKLGKKVGTSKAADDQPQDRRASNSPAPKPLTASPTSSPSAIPATNTAPAAPLAAASAAAATPADVGRQPAQASQPAASSLATAATVPASQPVGGHYELQQGASDAHAAQRDGAQPEAAGPSLNGPSHEAVDYTHDSSLELWGRDTQCDFGAGPLELEPGSPGEAVEVQQSRSASATSQLSGGGDAAELRSEDSVDHGSGARYNQEPPLQRGDDPQPAGLHGENAEPHECALDLDAGARHEPDSLAARDSSGSPLAQPDTDAAAAANGAAGAAAGGGRGGNDGSPREEPPLSDPLATMVYLTEEEEAGGDALSVLSDGMTEEELAEELSELEQALSALEGEALYGASPGAGGGSRSGVSMSPGASLDRDLAEKLGLAQGDEADPSGYAKQMVKLYTTMGLKLMDSRKFDESLAMMRKAEALVENDTMWGPPVAVNSKRMRLQAITYNNLGCLFKRRNLPQQALQYLTKALAIEEETGHVHNAASTHLNICAAYSSLRRYREALAHAERAIVLLQRALWPHSATFHDGLMQLSKVLAATASDKKLLSGVNVLAIAYHNAALEHERLGKLKEAHVCFTRASTLALKCLGPRASLSTSLQRALKAFMARHQQARGRAAGTAAGSRAGSQATQVKVRQTSPKRGATRSSRPPTGARAVGSSSRSALAASSAKGTLPLDKGVRGFGKSASSGKLGGERR